MECRHRRLETRVVLSFLSWIEGERTGEERREYEERRGECRGKRVKRVFPLSWWRRREGEVEE
jgi:3'-phosphoadenosine 5'-phosphosulfate sulfotransferase (PAPS reductase)/FAD synthetase